MTRASVLSDAARRALGSFIESEERLDVLLHVRRLGASPEDIAGACNIPLSAAAWHVAELRRFGFVGRSSAAIQAIVDELARLDRHHPIELRAALRAAPPRALIAEDDADMREILGSMLAARGLRVVALPTGSDALARATTELFTMAIVDVRMFVAAGVLLLRALRARSGHTALIVTTGCRTSRLDSDLMGIHAVEVLEKPFELDELARAVERATRSDCRRVQQGT